MFTNNIKCDTILVANLTAKIRDRYKVENKITFLKEDLYFFKFQFLCEKSLILEVNLK